MRLHLAIKYFVLIQTPFKSLVFFWHATAFKQLWEVFMIHVLPGIDTLTFRFFTSIMLALFAATFFAKLQLTNNTATIQITGRLLPATKKVTSPK